MTGLVATTYGIADTIVAASQCQRQITYPVPTNALSYIREGAAPSLLELLRDKSTATVPLRSLHSAIAYVP
jgi:hypothetical protein